MAITNTQQVSYLKARGYSISTVHIRQSNEDHEILVVSKSSGELLVPMVNKHYKYFDHINEGFKKAIDEDLNDIPLTC